MVGIAAFLFRACVGCDREDQSRVAVCGVSDNFARGTKSRQSPALTQGVSHDDIVPEWVREDRAGWSDRCTWACSGSLGPGVRAGSPSLPASQSTGGDRSGAATGPGAGPEDL
ncbi:hypothetical protein CHELA1G11_13222 [Hyphomicrobiales bacterium]|nr:hypothetical protein CHELA1G11_13222 [Hyphomicrobiales bacterium]